MLPKISFVVPCYNERATIESVVSCIRSAWSGPLEVVCVDDFSTDGTREYLLSVEGSLVDKVVLHQVNQGKGAALRSGFAVASGELIAIQDADLEYDPAAYQELAVPLIDGVADVCYGSRFLGICFAESCRFYVVVNTILSKFCNLVTGLDLTDMETCQKLIRKDFLDRIELRENRFAFEPEVTIKLAAAGARFVERRIGYKRRSVEEGKKIGWRDGVAALFAIFRHAIQIDRGRFALRNACGKLLPMIMLLLLFTATNGPSAAMGTLLSRSDGFLESNLMRLNMESSQGFEADGSPRSINGAIAWLKARGETHFDCMRNAIGMPATKDSLAIDPFLLEFMNDALHRYVCLRVTTQGYPQLTYSATARYVVGVEQPNFRLGSEYKPEASWGVVVVASRRDGKLP